MELSVSDRLIILSLLPKEGDITTLRILRELKEDLGFDLVEYNDLNFVNEGEKVTWDNSKEKTKEIHMEDVRKNIIRDSFKKLNDRKQLREEHIPLYEKFVEGK